MPSLPGSNICPSPRCSSFPLSRQIVHLGNSLRKFAWEVKPRGHIGYHAAHPLQIRSGGWFCGVWQTGYQRKGYSGHAAYSPERRASAALREAQDPAEHPEKGERPLSVFRSIITIDIDSTHLLNENEDRCLVWIPCFPTEKATGNRTLSHRSSIRRTRVKYHVPLSFSPINHISSSSYLYGVVDFLVVDVSRLSYSIRWSSLTTFVLISW